MPKTILGTKNIDKKGKHFVVGIVNEMGGIIEEIKTDDDFGFDFYIQLVEESKKTEFIPLVMRAQLKSGDSHFRNETVDKFNLFVREKDVDVWRYSNTPVILIAYKSSEDKAYWINIRKYIEDSNYKGSGSLKVKFTKKNVFDKNAGKELLFILYNEQRGLLENQVRLYKPIYTYLLNKYGNIDNEKLEKYQKEYYNIFKSFLDKKDYNNHKLKISIEFALSQRILYSTSNAITNLEDLKIRIQGINKSLNNNLLKELEYYQTILYLEDLRTDESKNAFQRYLDMDTKFKRNFPEKYFLITAMIYDLERNYEKCLMFYDKVLKNIRIKKNKILIGTISLRCGVVYRIIDEYKHSINILKKCRQELKNDKYYSAIVEANLAAAYSLNEEYDNSKNYYESAIEKFLKLGDVSATSSMYLNLSNVYINSRKYSESYTPFVTHLQNMSKNIFDIVQTQTNIGQGHMLEQIIKSYKHPNDPQDFNFIEGLRGFNKAINYNENLGDITNKRMIHELLGKYSFILGKIRSDIHILLYALSIFIIANNTKGIKLISEIGLHSQDEKSFLLFLEWLYKLKGDRLAELGRLTFFKEYADYIPQKLFNKSFQIVKECESKKYDFDSDFDYGRNSIEVLKSFANRLNKTQTTGLLRRILKNLDDKNHIIFESNIDLLCRLNLKYFTDQQILKIIEATKKNLKKFHDKYKVFYLWYNISKAKPKHVKNIYSMITQDCNGKNKLEYNAKTILVDSVFIKYRSSEIDEEIVTFFCNQLNEQSRNETIYSYGIGRSSEINGLKIIYNQVDDNLKKCIVECLLDYVEHENLIASKRTEALEALSYIYKSIPKKYYSKLKKIFNSIISAEGGEFKIRRSLISSQETSFHNYLKLKVIAFECIVKLKLLKSSKVISILTDLLIRSKQEETLLSIINILGVIGNVYSTDRFVSNVVKNYLMGFIQNDNPIISLRAVINITKIIQYQDKVGLEILMYNLNKLVDQRDYIRRIAVGKAIKELREQKIRNKTIIELQKILSNDINFQVRNSFS